MVALQFSYPCRVGPQNTNNSFASIRLGRGGLAWPFKIMQENIIEISSHVRSLRWPRSLHGNRLETNAL